MLLAIVNANGMYSANEGRNILPTVPLNGYHNKLARLAARHLLNEQPVAYLPYWSDTAGTGIHHDIDLQAAALEEDPFLKALPSEVRPGVNIVPDGPRSSVDVSLARLRHEALDTLALGQARACFVGIYAGFRVMDLAVEMRERMNSDMHVFIDPGYCVESSARSAVDRAAGWFKIERYSRYSE